MKSLVWWKGRAGCHPRSSGNGGKICSMRAHKESEGENIVHFLSIMELLAKHNPTVKRKMTSQRNATYLGHNTQNEIIDCLAEMLPKVRLSAFWLTRRKT